MATIQNICRAVNGSALAGVVVTVALSWDTDVEPMVRDEAGDIIFVAPSKTHSDGSGDWSMEVTPNDVLTPNDSVYKVTETYTDTSGTDDVVYSFTYYIVVPSGATPVYWSLSLIVPTPAWEED